MSTSFGNGGDVTVLEGMDGTGKTSLANYLQARYRLTTVCSIHHQGRYHGQPVLETLDAVASLAPAHGYSVVTDRLHVGELVYGPIMRHVDSLGLAGLRMVDRALLSRRAVLVLCCPPKTAAMAIWGARALVGKEMFTDAEKMNQIYDRFREVAQLSHLPVVYHDWARSYAEIGDFIDLVRPPENQGPGIGYFHPGVTLVVGEQVNGPHETPFVADGGCSRWLAEQLTISEKQLYWVNALSKDGADTDPRFLAALRPRKVVALGLAAGQWCMRHVRDTHMEFFEHPAYHRRFKSGQPYPAVAAINREGL